MPISRIINYQERVLADEAYNPLQAKDLSEEFNALSESI